MINDRYCAHHVVIFDALLPCLCVDHRRLSRFHHGHYFQHQSHRRHRNNLDWYDDDLVLTRIDYQSVILSKHVTVKNTTMDYFIVIYLPFTHSFFSDVNPLSSSIAINAKRAVTFNNDDDNYTRNYGKFPLALFSMTLKNRTMFG